MFTGVTLSGIAAREHVLGNSLLRGVPQIVSKNLRSSVGYAHHVRCSCWNSYGFIWTPEELVRRQISYPLCT